MSKKVRAIIFYIFLTVFLLAAPLIVLYTAGYRLSLNNQRLHRSGVVAISTIPRSANVVLDGQAQSGRTPLVIQRVDAGRHTITLSKKGYHEVSVEVPVEANQTSYVHLPIFADAQATSLPALPDVVATEPGYKTALVDNGSNIEVRLIKNGQIHLAALLPQDSYKTLLANADILVLTSTHDELYVVNAASDGVRAVGARATMVDYLENERLLLFSDGLEVNTLNIDSGEKTLITRESSVRAVAWHPSGEAVILAIGSEIRALGLDNFGARPSVILATGVNADSLKLDDAGKRLWFTTENGSSAYVLPLAK